jgi:cellulose synthase/poly-beta-1,6-N-acetylglucosamine synthase-like glycosyltransferase
MAETGVFAILIAFGIVYAGYPLAILLLAAGRRARPLPSPAGEKVPSVSVIVCAYNEEASIGDKLASVAAAERSGPVEIIVADDGSSDRTAYMVRAAASISPVPVRLIALPRGGKAAALGHACAAAGGSILIFTDADPLWESGTLEALIAPFADPRVGAVAGQVLTLKARSGAFGGGDALFRRYETALREAEDRLFGCVSADGGLFALRASLVEPVPPDVTDDFFLSTAAVARGCRIAFRADARVHEASPGSGRQHFRRRLRITVRGLTGLWRRRALMNPLRTGWYAVGLIFHKVLRRLAPVLLIPLWLLSLALTVGGAGGVYALLCAGLTLGAAGAGLLLLLSPLRLPRPLRLPLYAALHVAGLAGGTLLFLLGRRYTQWTPQQRT